MIKKRVTENDDATAECLSTSSPRAAVEMRPVLRYPGLVEMSVICCEFIN